MFSVKKITAVFLFAIIFLSVGCENSQWFQSESKLRKKIQGTWKRQFLDARPTIEHWTFTDGQIKIDSLTNSVVYPLDSGTYEIDAKLTAAYIIISGFNVSADSVLIHYNGKWTIVECSDELLYLVSDFNKGNIIQREFSRVQ